MPQNEVESNALLFFYLLKECQSIRTIKISLSIISTETFIAIVVENSQLENVRDLLEFQVGTITLKGNYSLEGKNLLNTTVLTQLFKVSYS